MDRADMRTRRTRLGRCVLASLLLSACTEWHTSPRAASDLYPSQRIPRARVTVAGGAQLILADARVRPDTIIGTEPNSTARVAIPANQVVKLESQEYSQFRTVSLFAGIGLAFLAVTLYMVAHEL
jgi:hypothetical protein